MMSKTLPLFVLFLLMGCTVTSDRQKSIAIQPFEDFPQQCIDSLIPVLQNEFGKEIIVLPSIELPQHAFINIKSPRYRADSLIVFLKERISDSCSNILGLTTKDISITKRDKKGNIRTPEYKYNDFGIFGLAFRPGKSAIVSTYRIGKTSKANKLERFKKISTHEVGHNLGLPHCSIEKTCVMADAAESIKTVDNCNPTFCNSCLEIIGL